MAKRNGREPLVEEEKRPISKANLKKLIGIFNFLLPYKWTFISGLISLVLSSIMLMAFPLLIGQLVDMAQGKDLKYFTSINQIGIALIAVLFAQGTFSFVRVYTFSKVSESSLADVRNAVFKKLIWLPVSFFDSRRVGELVSRMTSDVAMLQETFTTTLAELLRQGITLILGTTIIVILVPKLTFFMLMTFPVLVILGLIFGKFIRKLSGETQDKLAISNVIIEECLHSIVVVKSFTNELFETLRYKKSMAEAVFVAIRAARYRGLFISFIIVALFGGIVCVIWYGASLLQSHVITTGQLFYFVLYTAFIGGSIAGLGDIYSQLQRAIGASERVLEILNEKDETESGKELNHKKILGKIEFDEVSFSYPSRPEFQVLQELSFTIEPGEKIALVGPSGSGKSTIINLLMRFYPNYKGQILVDKEAINNFNLTTYRHNFGVVPQEVILFGGTINENIAYGKPGATNVDIYEAARKANALEFIESFPEKFETLVGERGVKLSGGQRQRIAIARAILKNPAVLILDEATSSLDAHSEVLVQEALEKLMHGRTSIIIAHRLSTIKKVDRIFVIKDGKLVEMGSHSELSHLDNGVYSNLRKLQLQ